MSKRCPSCGELLPASAFGRNRALPDGLSFYCLRCNRERNNAWYRKRRASLGQEVRDLSWVPDGFRWCPQCRQAVPHEDYTRNSRTASGFGGRCKRCHSAASSASYFYRKYKLTPRQLAHLRRGQDDRCAICGDPEPQHLDHDHVSGATRQLLCQRCNHGLGLFRDDPQLLRAAADYVELHIARQGSARAERTVRPGAPPGEGDRRPGSRRTDAGRRTRRTAGTADESPRPADEES
jgi:hypothetical protein